MVRTVILYALILSFTLVFSNDISSQAPEDQDEDGSGDDDVSGFGSGAILIQDTITSKPGHIEAILTTVSPLKSTTDQQSAVDELQSTSDMVITSAAKDLEENVLVGLEEIHKSNASEPSEMKTNVMIQVNPTEEASVVSITNSTSTNAHNVVHHFDPSATEGKGVPESTTADLFEEDLKEFFAVGDVHFNRTMAIPGDAVPTKNVTFEGKFGLENGDAVTTKNATFKGKSGSEIGIIEGSGQPELTGEFFFETTTESPTKLHKEDRSFIEASVENGTTDASKGIMDRKEVLGGVIAGGLVGLLFAGFLVGFMLYRMKKKDEGSYSLEEPKHSNGGYQKPQKQEEFFA